MPFIRAVKVPQGEYLTEGDTYSVAIGEKDVYFTSTLRGSGTFTRRSRYAQLVKEGFFVLIPEAEVVGEYR